MIRRSGGFWPGAPSLLNPKQSIEYLLGEDSGQAGSHVPVRPLAQAGCGISAELPTVGVADIWQSCCLLALWMVNAPVAAQEFANLQLLDFIFKSDVWYRTKRSRFALPVSLGDFAGLVGLPRETPLERTREAAFFQVYGREAWSLVACLALNCLAGAWPPSCDGLVQS